MTGNNTTGKGRLYLIPSPIGDNDPGEVIPRPVLEKLAELTCVFVHNLTVGLLYDLQNRIFSEFVLFHFVQYQLDVVYGNSDVHYVEVLA